MESNIILIYGTNNNEMIVFDLFAHTNSQRAIEQESHKCKRNHCCCLFCCCDCVLLLLHSRTHALPTCPITVVYCKLHLSKCYFIFSFDSHFFPTVSLFFMHYANFFFTFFSLCHSSFLSSSSFYCVSCFSLLL